MKSGEGRRLREEFERRHGGDVQAAHREQPAEEARGEARFKRGEIGAHVGNVRFRGERVAVGVDSLRRRRSSRPSIFRKRGAEVKHEIRRRPLATRRV